MTTAAPSAALATIQPAFTDAERFARAGFLAGYRGLTREAYALNLRQSASWCRSRSLALFAVRRADIEGFARDLEAIGPPVRARPGSPPGLAFASSCKEKAARASCPSSCCPASCPLMADAPPGSQLDLSRSTARDQLVFTR